MPSSGSSLGGCQDWWLDLVFGLAQRGKCVISALAYGMMPELTAPPLQDAIAKD